jgi:prolipoprotein diacylglyceryltransferase
LLCILVFTARFFIEFLKEVQVPFEAAMKLNMGQWLSIPFILLGIGGLYWSIKMKKKAVIIRQ